MTAITQRWSGVVRRRALPHEPHMAHLLRPPQDVKKDFMRLIAPNVRASQGTTVVLIKKSLASPKKFLQPKKRDFMG